ncbi:MAG TPA: GlsB/YeaQ/YmgE family stress response membrane protein [Miltoncostaea sp.]|nr:GlsB/YeaQ/YmgE family stress response membrane protein [Miltoncostaea sp.]
MADGIAGSHRTGGTMGIIAFIILGLLAGIIAKAIMPGRDPGGIIVTTLIGIAGALLGGFLASAIFDAHPLDDFFDVSTWLTAIVGAIILLAIYRVVVGDGHRRHGLTH